MRIGSLKEFRTTCLRCKQQIIVERSGVSLSRISQFECGMRIPCHQVDAVARGYQASPQVIMALSQGNVIQIVNVPAMGRDMWTIQAPPGGEAHGDGKRVEAAGHAAGMSGSSGVDGTAAGA